MEINRSPFFFYPYVECRFTQELKLKIEKDARDHHLQKKSKIGKRDKDDVLEERKMLGVQVGPSLFSRPVFLCVCVLKSLDKYVQQFKFIAKT